MVIRRTGSGNDDEDVIRPQSFAGVARGSEASGNTVVRNQTLRTISNEGELLGTGTQFKGVPARRAQVAGGRRRGTRGRGGARIARPDKSQLRGPSDHPQVGIQQAASNLVTAPDSGEVRDKAGDQAALFDPSAGIAGITEGAVEQEGAQFDSVSDPLSGFSVPNLADPQTKESFDRFFQNQRGGFQSKADEQRNRNSDPTRVAFQNRFFPSETLGDAKRKKQRGNFPNRRQFNA